jgi:hypothetical protein
MTKERVARVTAVMGLSIFGFFAGACRRNAPVESDAQVARVVKDTASVVVVRKETAHTHASFPNARAFQLREPGQRDSLRATVRRERQLWLAGNVRDYEFLLRVDCFCPGKQGWLLMEVRNGRLVRASDNSGKSVPLNDWNTFSVEGLFDNLERKADIDGMVEVAFDPRWHFPAYVNSTAIPGPDRWAIIETRGFRRLP